MTAFFLVSETTVHANGEGSFAGVDPCISLLVTIGITKVIEQQALTLTIHGSINGKDPLPGPLASLPQKFYIGLSSVLIDLSAHPEVRYLRAQWKTVRWGRGDKTPSFTFYVFAEPVSEAATAG